MSVKTNEREFITRKLALQEILKRVLQAQMKGDYTIIPIHMKK